MIYLLYFLHFQGLNFVFSSFKDTFVSKLQIQGQKWLFTQSYSLGRRKVKKILCDKYVPMLAIRDGHVDNHFSEKFIHLCHVGYFINEDERKLTVEYICRTFYTFGD